MTTTVLCRIGSQDQLIRTADGKHFLTRREGIAKPHPVSDRTASAILKFSRNMKEIARRMTKE